MELNDGANADLPAAHRHHGRSYDFEIDATHLQALQAKPLYLGPRESVENGTIHDEPRSKLMVSETGSPAVAPRPARAHGLAWLVLAVLLLFSVAAHEYGKL